VKNYVHAFCIDKHHWTRACFMRSLGHNQWDPNLLEFQYVGIFVCQPFGKNMVSNNAPQINNQLTYYNFIELPMLKEEIWSFKWSIPKGYGTVSIGFVAEFHAWVGCRCANCLSETLFYGWDTIWCLLGWGTTCLVLKVLTRSAPRFGDFATPHV